MNGLRLIVVAAVLLLALAASGVRAGASDSWNAPAAESWPSLEEFANEIELSHREFVDVLSASSSSSSTGVNVVSSSSTGVNKPSSSSTGTKASSSSTGANKASSSSTGTVPVSSSSTGVSVSVSSSSSTADVAPTTVTTYQPAALAVTAPYNASTVPGGSASAYADIVAQGIKALAGDATVNVTACFIPISSDATTCDGASSSRRLLQAEATKMLLVIVIIPANPSDSSASIIATGVAAQLGCGNNATCQAEQAAVMTANLQAAAPAGVIIVAAPTLATALATAANNSGNPALAAAISAGVPVSVVPGSLSTGVVVVTIVPSSSSSSTGDNAAALNAQPAPTVATAGHANSTNSGYYVEAAVLALSCILSAVYMVMHKVDPSAVGKSHYAANTDAALAPVPSAEPAHGHVSVVNPEESAPLGSQGQMDYMSVFALRNNVLQNKDNTPAEDNSNQNDVHFILHQ